MQNQKYCDDNCQPDAIRKRDAIAYEVMFNRYKFEWQRYRDINNEAATFIVLLGVVVTIWVSIGLHYDKYLSENGNYFIIYIVTSVFYLISIIFAAISIKYGHDKMMVVPEHTYFINKVIKKYTLVDDIKPALAMEFYYAIDKNSDINLEKNGFLRNSIQYFIYGLITTIFTPHIFKLYNMFWPLIDLLKPYILLILYIPVIPLAIQCIIFYQIHMIIKK